MDTKFIINGFNGKRKLRGEFQINGAKNNTTPAMAMSLLFKDNLKIKNAAQAEDMKRVGEILEKMGAEVEFGKKKIEINCKKINKHIIDRKIGGMIRSSIILTGPTLARFGKVQFSFPGGCAIGERPIDIFLEAYKKMGAKVSYTRGVFSVSVRKLRGANIFFKMQSVTATETIAMLATMAHGKTTLQNCAMEPEVTNLLNFLVKAGAKIKGIGSPTLEIIGNGGKLFSSKKSKAHTIIPDRIETGSVLVLAALMAKDVKITKCHPEHLTAVIDALKRAGVKMEVGSNFIRIKNQKSKNFKGIKIKTHEYPGFPTDMQSQMGVFMTQARGTSRIQETIFAGRLDYLNDLKRMGANVVSRDSSNAVINGPKKLKAKALISPDLRGGFAFIIAAVIAQGKTNLGNAYYIKRGYENIVERLQNIGVDIKAVKENNV